MPNLFVNEHLENGRFSFTTESTVKPALQQESVQRIRESAGDSKVIIKPKIAAIHEGRTANNTIYTEQSLRGAPTGKNGPHGMFSFTKPYPKPMIKNHDTYTEPTGRIMNAQYVKNADKPGYIMITPHITDPDAIEKVLDGRYMTVSIGASTDSAICNVCGTDIINEGWCGHQRGEVYDGTTCGWILGELCFDECSWVNVPSDNEAMVLEVGEVEVYADTGKEHLDLSTGCLITESALGNLGLEALEVPPIEEPAATEEEAAPAVEESQSETDQPAETSEPPVDNPMTEESHSAGEDAENASATEPAESADPESQTRYDTLQADYNAATALLAERTAECERLSGEVTRLSGELAHSQAQLQSRLSEFHTFVSSLITQESETYQLETLSVEELSALDVNVLCEKLQTLRTESSLKFQDLANFKVANPMIGNTEQIEIPAAQESRNPPQKATPVEIYANLLGGRKPRK